MHYNPVFNSQFAFVVCWRDISLKYIQAIGFANTAAKFETEFNFRKNQMFICFRNIVVNNTKNSFESLKFRTFHIIK